jgi:hypothetical protein
VRPRPAICPSPTGPPGAGGGRFLEMAGRLDVVLTYWPPRPSKRVVADRQTSAIRLPRGDGGSPLPSLLESGGPFPDTYRLTTGGPPPAGRSAQPDDHDQSNDVAGRAKSAVRSIDSGR